MSEIEKYYNGEIIVDFEEETELEKKYNEVAELYSKAVKKKIEYRKEIERLNNIINELEKWVKSEYDRYYNDKENLVFSNVEVIDFGRVLDKLQELKGDGK